METIDWEEFEKVDIRVGTVLDVKEFKQAVKPALKLRIDFGENLGIKKSSAQITVLYSEESLMGKQVLAVVNFRPKQIGPFISECLVLGLYNDNDQVVLAVPDKTLENGSRLC